MHYTLIYSLYSSWTNNLYYGLLVYAIMKDQQKSTSSWYEFRKRTTTKRIDVVN